jgi:hypothetical protein
MRNFALLATVLVLSISVSSAQSTDTVNPEPGLVKPGGLLYGLDVAFDNGLQEVGLKSPGEVAFERASEVSVAEERNNSRGVEMALNGFSQAVEQSNNDDFEALERSESVLRNVSSRVPEEASQGLSSALESVEEAKNRVPEELTAEGMRSRGSLLPDIEMPDIGGGESIDVPGSEASSSRGR